MENFDQMKEISTGGEYVLIHQGVGSDITDSDQIVIKTEVSVDDWNGFDPITRLLSVNFTVTNKII